MCPKQSVRLATLDRGEDHRYWMMCSPGSPPPSTKNPPPTRSDLLETRRSSNDILERLLQACDRHYVDRHLKRGLPTHIR